jgi:hypothetical protein
MPEVPALPHVSKSSISVTLLTYRHTSCSSSLYMHQNLLSLHCCRFFSCPSVKVSATVANNHIVICVHTKCNSETLPGFESCHSRRSTCFVSLENSSISQRWWFCVITSFRSVSVSLVMRSQGPFSLLCLHPKTQPITN